MAQYKNIAKDDLTNFPTTLSKHRVKPSDLILFNHFSSTGAVQVARPMRLQSAQNSLLSNFKSTRGPLLGSWMGPRFGRWWILELNFIMDLWLLLAPLQSSCMPVALREAETEWIQSFESRSIQMFRTEVKERVKGIKKKRVAGPLMPQLDFFQPCF